MGNRSFSASLDFFMRSDRALFSKPRALKLLILPQPDITAHPPSANVSIGPDPLPPCQQKSALFGKILQKRMPANFNISSDPLPPSQQMSA